MQCGTCGNALASGLTSCSSCGAPQAIQAQNQQGVNLQPPPNSPLPPAPNTPYTHQQPPSPMNQMPDGTPKNKTLMIVLIAVGVLVLLGIIGAVIFFVTNKSDSEEKSDDDSQEESEEVDDDDDDDDDDDPDNEDATRDDDQRASSNQDLKLEDLGFDCQMTAFLETSSNENHKENIENSKLSGKSFATCEHNDEYIDIGVLELADADLLVDLIALAVCEEDGLSEDQREEALGNVEAEFEQYIVISSDVYMIRNHSDGQKFKALLDEAGIEYEAKAYKVAELSCDD